MCSLTSTLFQCYFPQNQSCPFFARRGFKWQCYKKLHIDQFWVLKGLNQSNKIGMLHKVRGKIVISLRSPSPSLIVLPAVLSRMFSPTPFPPSYFIWVEIRQLLIGTWCLPSTTVPVAVQTSFVFLCACLTLSSTTLLTLLTLSMKLKGGKIFPHFYLAPI